MNITLENDTDNSLPNISSIVDNDRIMYTAVNSINLALGLPVNGYVLWLILSGAGGGTTIASEFFFLNLMVSVVTSLLSSVFYFLCHTALFSAMFVFYVSAPSFQCCICVERYVAVVHPVVFLRYKALRYRAACCCVVWLAVLAFSVGFTVHTSAALLTLAVYILLGFYLVCISVVCFCCLSVLRALKQPGPGEGQRDGGTGGEGNHMKRRAFKIILTSLIVMLLLMVIFSVTMATSLFKLIIPRVYGDVAYASATMSGLVHPLLYIHKAGKLPCFKRF